MDKEFKGDAVTLEEAVLVARIAQAAARSQGYNIALTGSVLYQGESSKDMDLMLYPHKPERAENDESKVLEALEAVGFVEVRRSSYEGGHRGHHHGYPRRVVVMSYMGYRVDVFLPDTGIEKKSMPKT